MKRSDIGRGDCDAHRKVWRLLGGSTFRTVFWRSSALRPLRARIELTARFASEDLRDGFGQATMTALWEFQLSGLRAEERAGRP